MPLRRDDAGVKLPGRSREPKGPKPSLRPILAWRWTLAALMAFLIVTVGVMIWLLIVADQAKAGSLRATAQLDAVRTTLAAGAGAGAAAVWRVRRG